VLGCLHGVYQIVGDITQNVRKSARKILGIKQDSALYKLSQTIGTFILVDIAWIFFRASGIKEAIGYIQHMILFWNPWAIWDTTLYTLGLTNYDWNILLIACLVLFFADTLRYQRSLRIDSFLWKQDVWGRGVCVLFLAIMIYVFGIYGVNYDGSQFIYFQF
jgi:hypothetical protein